MELLYIAAPYTAPTHIQFQHNIHEASLMAQFYWIKGFSVICPHLNTSFFGGLVDESTFYKGTLKMLEVCTHTAFHPKWTTSHGSINEYKHAISWKKVIHFTDMSRVTKTLNDLFPEPKCIDDMRKDKLCLSK